MRKMFLDKEDMDYSAILEEEEEEDLTIQTMGEGTVLKNWTVAPSRVAKYLDYFTKWVEAASYKVVTKKVVAYFVWDRIICRFGVPESIITDNAANFNSDLMKAMYETFNIKHQNSTAYRPQMNGDEESASKNIKKILRKMMDNYNQWHESYNILCLGTAPQFVRQLGQHLIYCSTDEAKGKFSPNWQGPYMVHRVLTGEALILAEIDG
nr:uncharacterized protein LOC117279009 [Nicotiana tomentosiformis]